MMEQEFDVLKKVKKVDAPPFLLTRIHQRIKNLSDTPVTASWKFAFASIAIVLIILNVSVFFQKKESNNLSNINSVVIEMQLSNSNNLYNE